MSSINQQTWGSVGSLGTRAVPGWHERLSSLAGLSQPSSFAGAGGKGGHHEKLLPPATLSSLRQKP